MSKEEVMPSLRTIICKVLENNSISVNEETTVEDIEGWDSLTHVQLSAAIEEKFGFKLTLREMLSWETIGELAECIESKL